MTVHPQVLYLDTETKMKLLVQPMTKISSKISFQWDFLRASRTRFVSETFLRGNAKFSKQKHHVSDVYSNKMTYFLSMYYHMSVILLLFTVVTVLPHCRVEYSLFMASLNMNEPCLYSCWCLVLFTLFDICLFPRRLQTVAWFVKQHVTSLMFIYRPVGRFDILQAPII